MKLKAVKLHRTTVVPGIGTVRDQDLGEGLVEGPWVVIQTPAGGRVAIWGADVAPSEVIDADPVRPSAEAPARGRARPPGAEGQ